MIGVITEDFAREFESKILTHLIYDPPGLKQFHIFNKRREMIADQQNHVAKQEILYNFVFHLFTYFSDACIEKKFYLFFCQPNDHLKVCYLIIEESSLHKN